MEYKSGETLHWAPWGAWGDLLKQHDPWGEGLRRAGAWCPVGSALFACGRVWRRGRPQRSREGVRPRQIFQSPGIAHV